MKSMAFSVRLTFTDGIFDGMFEQQQDVEDGTQRRGEGVRMISNDVRGIFEWENEDANDGDDDNDPNDES